MHSKNAKVKSVSTADRLITIWLDDGRIVSAPLAWYPTLIAASGAERRVWQRAGAGNGIYWPALDYDLSVEGILAGRKEHPHALRSAGKPRLKNRKTGKTAPRRKLATV